VELRHYRHVLALVEHEKFRRAAEALGIAHKGALRGNGFRERTPAPTHRVRSRAAPSWAIDPGAASRTEGKGSSGRVLSPT
jgi:hypothetical protein